MDELKNLRDQIYKILEIHGAENKASWWNIADEIINLFPMSSKSLSSDYINHDRTIHIGEWLEASKNDGV